MGLRELVILVLILAIVGVILRGLYVALKARRGQLRMALEKNIPQYDPDELSLSELPNGGARMVERSFAQVVRQNSEFSSRDRPHKGRPEQTIPVLMDTVTDDYDDDGVGSVRTAPSAVAGARQAASQRHGIKSGFARPSQKPTHRPIDRMAELQQHTAAAATTAAAPALYETPLQETPQPPYADPLDSHVFGDDEVEEPRYDAPAFESPSLAAAAEDDYHYETDFANDQNDDDYEDDEGDEVVEQKTGPRRWLQWAGEKLSGMTAAAASEGERVREEAAEEQARARAEMNDQAARAASNAASNADSKAARKGRTERAEPVFGAASFDDALLDDDQDYQDRRSFNEPAPAPSPRQKLEPLDRPRQSELNLDEPEELRAESRIEARIEARIESTKEQQPESEPVLEYSEVLVVNVVAKPDREFTGMDLLPVLLTSGLRFGDMSIFHRHIEADISSPVLFSVANIVNPGTFDLNQINNFSTRGLCFFMTLPNVANSMQAFDKMLDVAQQVRIALDGDLKDDNRSVMTAQTIAHYRQRVRDFDLRQLRQHK